MALTVQREDLAPPEPEWRTDEWLAGMRSAR
jgi:hypothetical protein